MSDERDRARVISEYADDLIARRASDPQAAEARTESDLARMLDVTRALTEIAFEPPPELTKELLAAAREEGASRHRTRETGMLGRSFTSIVRLLHTRGSWQLGRPVGAFIAVAVVASVFFVRRDPTVSASELLTKSARAEAVRLEPPGFVARRAFTIEAQQTADRKPLRTQHVEVLVNPRARIKARRLFDDRQLLVGGEWTQPDGSRIVYERGKPPRTERASDTKPLTFDSIWRWEPSAEDFSKLAGDVARVRARKTDEGFELSLDEANTRLAHVELSLDNDHLPVAQRVILREDGEVIEVQTRRTVSEVLPESRVANTSFEPEPDLLPAVTTSALSTTARETTALSTPARSRLTEQAMDGLELQAWYRLHQLGRCLVEPSQLQRRGGQFHVRAVLTSATCRSEASRLLAPLQELPAISVELILKEPAINHLNQTSRSDPASPSNAPTDLDSDDALVTMPGYRLVYDFHARQALRESQSGRDVDAAVKPLVRRLALWALDRSARRLASARELQRLSTRWPPEALKSLGLDAASMWQAMVRDNARVLGEDTDLIVVTLGPALGVASETDESVIPAVRNLTDVSNAITELRALVEVNDAAIRVLFTPRPREDATWAAPNGPALVQSLRRAARLAARLTEPWVLEP
jgi:hypothetical protein